MRDIAHEQISTSTTEELDARYEELRSRLYAQRGYLPQDEMAELHRIESELYCRRTGIQSEPWVTHVGRGA